MNSSTSSSEGGWGGFVRTCLLAATVLITALLALAFLVMIGAVLIADGFGVHVPKGYVYGAMGFSLGVELLNMVQRKRRARIAAQA